MNPLLFPLVLILYAEGSYCVVTRKISRVVLYSYLITLLTTTYLESLDAARLSLLLIHTVCYLSCITLCQKLSGKVVFFVLMLGMWWIDLSIILNTLEYDITLFGYSLLNYSNYFYRELTIAAISLCAYISTKYNRQNTRENLLGLTTLLFFIIEKQF
jgi:hypothetical protein